MYDEKYFKKGNIKKIETVEQAKAIMFFYSHCGGCNTCPIRMFEKNKGNNCGSVKTEAERFLKDNGVDYDFSKDSVKNVTRGHLYNAIESGVYDYTRENTFGVAPATSTKGTCSACLHSQMHASGILWCKSFHNFVHGDGYCYRFSPSDNMEEEKAVEEVEKEFVPEGATEIELPF